MTRQLKIEKTNDIYFAIEAGRDYISLTMDELDFICSVYRKLELAPAPPEDNSFAILNPSETLEEYYAKR